MIGIVFGVINTLIVKTKMNKDNVQDNNFILVYGLLFTVPFALLQIIQLLGNYNSCFYILYREYSSMFYWLGITVILLFLITLVLLMMFKKETITKYSKYVLNNNYFCKTNNSEKFLLLMLSCAVAAAIFVMFIFPVPVEEIKKMENLNTVQNESVSESSAAENNTQETNNLLDSDNTDLNPVIKELLNSDIDKKKLTDKYYYISNINFDDLYFMEKSCVFDGHVFSNEEGWWAVRGTSPGRYIIIYDLASDFTLEHSATSFGSNNYVLLNRSKNKIAFNIQKMIQITYL